MTDLNGKVVLVTGSSRGIGAENPSGVRQTGRERRPSRPGSASAQVDATSPTAAATPCLSPAMSRSSPTSRSFGRAWSRPTVWSTCWLPAPAAAAAAPARSRISARRVGGLISTPQPDRHIPDDQEALLPGMKKRGTGSIITMSSAAGRRASARTLVAYGAQAGVQLLTQDLAAQVGPHGIRANCIAPETILTEKNKAWIPQQQQQELVQSHPLRRLTAGRRAGRRVPRLR